MDPLQNGSTGEDSQCAEEEEEVDPRIQVRFVCFSTEPDVVPVKVTLSWGKKTAHLKDP